MKPPYDSDSQLRLFERKPKNFQPNIFTESRQTFSELEKKIVILVINQLGDLSYRKQYEEGKNIKFLIPYAELTETNHAKLEEAADTLNERSIYNRNNPGIDKITPFPRVRTLKIDNRKYMEITMFADVVPLFVELGKRYTQYNLEVMLSLGSVYGQRMYEIIMMYKSRQQSTFRYSVDDLIYMLNCPATYTYKELNRWALVPAIKEIESKTNLHVPFKPSRKEGKKILELEFEVLTAEALAAQLVEQDRRIINGMSYNEAIVTAWQLFKEYKFPKWQKELIASDLELLNIFFRVHSEIVNGLRKEISNPTAYIAKSLKLDVIKPPKAKKEKPVPPARTHTPSSLASVMGNMELFTK